MRRIRQSNIEPPSSIWTPHKVAIQAGLRLSTAQSSILKAFQGEPLTNEELRAWRELTGTTIAKPRHGGYDELWLRVGRRGGKTTHIGAPIAVSSALLPVDHMLAPGEVARVLVVCPTLPHGRQAFDAIRGLLGALQIPFRERDREIQLVGRRTTILQVVADYLAPRSGTAIAAIVDEAALLPTQENADGFDVEIFAALRPALATTNGKLIVLSTPWARRGVHYETCEKYWGKVA